MTLATIISHADFGELLASAFQPETPQVTSSESDLGAALQHFATPAEIHAKVAQCASAGMHDYSFGFWYPSMKGRPIERKVILDPPREGHAFRHSLTGWGLIHLHLYFTHPRKLQCRIAVNSQTRAKAREARYPELGAVTDWDWRVVDSYAFRLSRKLAAMGPTAPVVQQADPGEPSPPPGSSSPWQRRKQD
ncbi:MAG TPA: hypothetical protein VGE22_17970 [Solimonas sp.]